MPTKAGWAFLGFTISLLLMGAIYNSQLVNLTAFLLLTLFSLAMVMTHQNLQGLSGFHIPVVEGFAGDVAMVDLSFENRTATLKEGLTFDLLPSDSRWLPGPALFTLQLEPQVTGRHFVHASLPLSPEKRGRYTIQRVRVQTLAPLGLFRAWRSEDVKFDIWIFPQRVRHSHDELRPQGHQGEASNRTDRADIWSDSHPAEFGGSLRRLDWTRTARHDSPWVRPWNAEDGEKYRLEWEKHLALPLEDRLSHFSYEIEQALKTNDALEVAGPWGERQIHNESARELWRLFAEWKT